MNKKIKLSLLGTLIAGSALAITLPIVSCSSSTSEDVKLTAFSTENTTAVENGITLWLTTHIQAGADKAAQEKIAAEWKTGQKIHTDGLAKIQKNMKFKDADGNEISGEKAIESVEYTSDTTIGESGDDITGPKLKINFKSGYTGDITLTTGTLGTVK